jgi:hypothetical protein
MTVEAATAEEVELLAGLDLGKLKDNSAFALFERRRPQLAAGEARVVESPGMGRQVITAPPRLPFSGTLTKAEQRARSWRYRLAKMQRWDVGTNYEDLLEWLVKAYSRSPEQGGLAGTTLAVDYTGVGVPVVEWLRKELRLAGAKAVIRPIWIMGGLKARENDAFGWNVPKKELVAVLQMLMGTRRLEVEARMKNCAALVDELKNFKEKLNKDTGNASYEAWREADHDDMVLAVAIILWVGEQATREFWVR